MEQAMIPVEYFLSAKYNQAYIGEMWMCLLMNPKWQNNSNRSSQSQHFFCNSS